MIQRQKEKYEVLRLTGERDEFAIDCDYAPDGSADCAIMLYSQSNTDDVRCKTATHIGICGRADVGDDCRIRSPSGAEYKVLLSRNIRLRNYLTLEEIRQ